jgi:deazaflavin-dependent oxidoreductase (nitroreductase family)
MTAADYSPSPTEWVARQVAQIEAAGDTAAVSMLGGSVVLVTMRGARTGAVRKVPLMRVERGGRYAAIASLGGSPRDPQWVANLRADPQVEVMDGTRRAPMRAREIDGDERQQWWAYAVQVFPDYADYQPRTERVFPIFLLEPRQG